MTLLSKAVVITKEGKEEKNRADLVINADSFVASEMGISDNAVNAHDENAARIISTKTKWINYKNELRDYVQSVDGTRKIMASKPMRPK